MTMIPDGDEALYHGIVPTQPPCECRDGIPCEPCNELAEIEARIEDLHSRRHGRARPGRNQIHDAFRIHRIPREIVTYIFTLAFAPQDAPCCKGKRSIRPLIITHVCHIWRVLALSTPSLWSNIFVNARNPNYPLLNHQVAHSGVVTLSIYFTDFPCRIAVPASDAEQVMCWVLKQLHRTASFYLYLSNKFMRILDSLSDLPYPQAAPSLQELHIHCWDQIGNFPSRKLRLAIEPPCPQRVHLDAFAYNPTFLDWANISSLTVEGGPVDVFLPELFASQHLKQLVFGWVYDEFPWNQALVNRSIEDLTLGTVRTAEFIFKMTSLPFLQRLEINTDERVEMCPTSTRMICDFLRQSRCPLRVLSMHNYGGDESTGLQGIIHILEITNMLYELSLDIRGTPEPPCFEPLVQRFSSQDGQFLPCLQTLTLKTDYPLSIDLLLDVITTDGHSSETSNGPDTVRPLRTLVVGMPMGSHGVGSDISRDEVLRILRLRTAGKTISINSSSWPCPDLVEYWSSAYGLNEDDN